VFAVSVTNMRSLLFVFDTILGPYSYYDVTAAIFLLAMI